MELSNHATGQGHLKRLLPLKVMLITLLYCVKCAKAGWRYSATLTIVVTHSKKSNRSCANAFWSGSIPTGKTSPYFNSAQKAVIRLHASTKFSSDVA